MFFCLSPQVCLQRMGEFLSLQVPGLAEGRPSVLIGDAVILSSPVDPEDPQYEGIVHEVRVDGLILLSSAESTAELMDGFLLMPLNT